jgi:hypothetical protein
MLSCVLYASPTSCFLLVDPGAGDAPDALLLHRCMDALCEIAVVEPFMSCILPRIISIITEKMQADECIAGIKSLR